MKMKGQKRIVVIGAGPIGLEAALYAKAAGYSVVVLERAEVGSNVGRWSFVRMFSPWLMNTTPLGRQAAGGYSFLASSLCPTAQEYIDCYLNPIANSPALAGCIDAGIRVLAVGRKESALGPDGEPVVTDHVPFRILVSDRFGVEQADHADVVLDCSGTYGNYRWAGRGGVPAVGEFGLRDRICYTLPDVLGRDRYRFADRHTLLIGTGTSAATVLMCLAQLAGEAPETRVTWAFTHWGQILRLIDEDPLPQRRALVDEVLKLATSPPSWLELLQESEVEAFSTMYGLTATLRRGEESISRRVDEVVAAVGYRPDEALFEPLGAHPRYVNADQTRPTVVLDHESVAPGTTPGEGVVCLAPGYYLLGAKSYGLNSNFLLRIGHAQVRDTFRHITGDAQLDLYAGSR